MANAKATVHQVGFVPSRHCLNGHRAVAKATWVSPNAKKAFNALLIRNGTTNAVLSVPLAGHVDGSLFFHLYEFVFPNTTKELYTSQFTEGVGG